MKNKNKKLMVKACEGIRAGSHPLPPPVCAHGDESRLPVLKAVRPATKIIGRNGRDCLP